MNIVVLGHSLKAPLTGIGHYTRSLIPEIARLNKSGTTTLVVPDTPEYRIDLENPFLTVVRLPLPRHLPRRVALFVWQTLIAPRWARNTRPDVVHDPGGFMGAVGPFTRRGVWTATIHDLTPRTLPKAHRRMRRLEFRILLPLASRHLSGVITDSQASLQDLRQVPWTRDIPATVAPLAAREVFHPGPPRNNQEGRYFLAVGSREPRKNLGRILDAFEEYIRLGGKADLVLVGPPGWMHEATDTRLMAASLQGRVRMTGYLDDAQLAAYYRGAVALLYPSLYEGFGLPIVEAMSCGCPVVTSNRSSMPEVAGDAAILVDPLSSSEILAAIQRVEEPGVQASMAADGLSRVARFSWGRTGEITLAFWDSLLTKGDGVQSARSER